MGTARVGVRLLDPTWTLERARTACKASTVRDISFCTAGTNERADTYDFDTWIWYSVCAGQRSIGRGSETSTPSPVSFTAPPQAPSRYRFLRIPGKLPATFRPCTRGSLRWRQRHSSS